MSSSAPTGRSKEASRACSRCSFSSTVRDGTPEISRDLFHFLVIHPAETLLRAAQIEEELALGLGRGHLDDAPVAQDVFVDLGPDPVDREGDETHAERRIESA